jgi:hypothetical protein
MRFASKEASPVNEFRLPTRQLVSATLFVEEMKMLNESKHEIKYGKKTTSQLAGDIALVAIFFSPLFAVIILIADYLVGPIFPTY